MPSSRPSPSSAATPCVGGGSSITSIAAVTEAKWLDPAGLEAGEVVMLEPADRTDRVGDGALVERLRAVAGDRAQRHRQLGQSPAQAARGGGESSGGIRAAAQEALVPDVAAQAAAVRAATANPRSAVSIASARQASSPSRPCLAASAIHPATAPGTVTERGPRSSTGATGSARRGAGPAASSPSTLLAGPDDGERVATDASRHRFGHAQHGRSGERRIGRVPALLEHPQPRSGRERLAGCNHALRSDGRRSPVREAERHQLRRLRSARRRPARPMCPVRPGRVATPPRPRGGCRTRRSGSS